MSDYTIPKAVDYKDLSKAARTYVTWSDGWCIQPKFDGCAMRVRQYHDGDGWVREAVSASNKPVLSCEHIVSDLATAYCGRPFELCMEVWHPSLPFSEISGAFRRHSGQPHLVAKVFDGWVSSESFPTIDFSKRPYWQRKDAMVGTQYSEVAYTEACLSEEQAWQRARELKARGGYDGVIVRNYEVPYQTGRSKGDIIKVKPLLEFDLMVCGFDEAVGEKTQRKTGALLCRWKPGLGYQKVATGLTHAQQAQLGAFVGKIIAVEAMGLTEDGYLREPRFKGERDDKIQPDF